MSSVTSFRLPSKTAQMLAEMSEETGVSKSALVQMAIALLYRQYHQVGGQVGQSSDKADKVETAPQDALRSQQEAQESVFEESDDSQDVSEELDGSQGVLEESDDSQDILEEWRKERREEERKKREKRKKEKKKKKHGKHR